MTHTLYTTEFLTFWANYPRRVGKFEAAKAWAKHRPILAEVLEALEWQRNQPAWTRDEGTYIPHASTYLNQRRWEDEPFNPPLDLTPRRGDTLGAHTAKVILGVRAARGEAQTAEPARPTSLLEVALSGAAALPERRSRD